MSDPYRDPPMPKLPGTPPVGTFRERSDRSPWFSLAIAAAALIGSGCGP